MIEMNKVQCPGVQYHLYRRGDQLVNAYITAMTIFISFLEIQIRHMNILFHQVEKISRAREPILHIHRIPGSHS